MGTIRSPVICIAWNEQISPWKLTLHLNIYFKKIFKKNAKNKQQL